MTRFLSYLHGNWNGTSEQLSPETTLDGEPIGAELDDPEAQPTVTPPAQPPAPGSKGEPPAPFHSWKDPTGKVHSFATADDLSKAMTQSFFLQSDYSHKTDGLKNREASITAREQALEKQANELKELDAKYKSFRDAMGQRPELFQQFQQMLGQPGTPQEAMSAAQNAVQPLLDEIKQELASLREWKESMNSDRQRETIHSKLAEEFGEDYDSKAVDDFFSAVNANDPESLYRFAHHALQGQKDPILAQKRAAEQTAANDLNKGVLSGGGNTPPAKGPASIAEGRDAALTEM